METACSVGIIGLRASGKTTAAISVLQARAAHGEFDAIVVVCNTSHVYELISRAFPHTCVRAPDTTYDAIRNELAKYPSTSNLAVIVEDGYVERKQIFCKLVKPSDKMFVIVTSQMDLGLGFKPNIILAFKGTSKYVMPYLPRSISEDSVRSAMTHLQNYEALMWNGRSLTTFKAT